MKRLTSMIECQTQGRRTSKRNCGCSVTIGTAFGALGTMTRFVLFVVKRGDTRGSNENSKAETENALKRWREGLCVKNRRRVIEKR